MGPLLVVLAHAERAAAELRALEALDGRRGGFVEGELDDGGADGALVLAAREHVDGRDLAEAAAVGLEVLGQARRVVVTKDHTTIVEGAGDAAAVDGRVAQIKAEIENTDSDWDREKLQERLAKLAGGVCVIKVGAATEVELKQKKQE